jgi:peptidyl-prolyl cis-trans isomerase D
MDDAPVDEVDVLAYYEANAARFQIPEQVKLDYLVLDVAALASNADVSEEELRRAYESDQARFGQPERRKVRHILLTVSPGADDATEAAALAEIEAVRKRIQDGEPFDQVAREVSKDPGSAAQGGSLGEVERGIMDPAFDEAAFSLPSGELSEPVRTSFGYHLIDVESVTPAAIKPFDEVRDQLRGEIAKQRAEALFYDMGERLANVVYESSDSLEPAAEELGLRVEHSDWVGRQGGEGLLGHPKVTGAAFSEDVLNEHRNSDLIEPEKDVLQAVVVRVADHREAAAVALDEVREEIVAALRQERALKAAAAAAAAAAEKLRDGADWAAVAGEDQLQGPELVSRNDPKLAAPVRGVAFSLPVPADGQSSVGTATFEDGDAAVVRVTKVEPGEATTPAVEGVDPARSMLGRLMGRQAYDAVLEDMESRADIERKPLSSPAEG